MDHEEEVIIYTDGSAWPNPGGRGGWSFVAQWREVVEERWGFVPVATNNSMELTALFKAMSFLKDNSKRSVVIVSDSKYAINSLTKWFFGWKRGGWISSSGTPVANRALIEAAHERMRFLQDTRHLKIMYTKGHVGTVLNERADQLAGDARKSGNSHEKGCKDIPL